MVFGFLGGRAFHIFYEAWDFYKVRPQDILKIWQGGFVFYGGFLSALVACFVFMWRKKLSWGRWTDLFAPVIALGYALGRIGCFLNGCCYGKICDLPWGIAFNYPGLPEGHRHPTQLYAVFWELFVLFILLIVEKGPTLMKPISRFCKKNRGALFALWLALHGFGRFLMEQFRDDARGAAIGNFSISSLIALSLVVASITFFLFKFKKKA